VNRPPAVAPPPGESETNRTARRAAWQAAHLDETGSRLLAEDARYFLRQAVSTPCLAAIRRAEGCWIEDTAGRRYLDFHGNSAHHLGYGHPRLLAALKAQLDDLSFAPRRFTCEPAVELAQRLIDISPPGLDKVLFATGGSDAIEIALKIARAATGRFKTLSFWDAFHGAGFGAASVGGEALFRSGPIGPLLAGTEHLPPFACYRCPLRLSRRRRGTAASWQCAG
jgi:4-aminobutyrate aminotransferase